MSELWRCRVFWGNPYTQPPSGSPRIVKAVLCSRPHPIPAEILEHCQKGGDWGPGTGWTIGWERIDQRPVRRWSQAAKARVRQGNLRRRIEKRYPLFAEQFISAELAARPSYYEAAE